MDIKPILLLVTLVIQISIFYRRESSLKKNIIFMIISLYCLKPYIEKYTGILDATITLMIFMGILLVLVLNNRASKQVEISIRRVPIFMLLVSFLIIINGVFHIVNNGEISSLYIQGLLNICFICVLMFFVFSNLKDVEELLNISKYTFPSFILLMFFGYYDYIVLRTVRIGDDVNPNYYAQMTIILFIFHIFNSKKIFSIKNLMITFSVFYLVILSDSSSAKISLIILGSMVLLYLFKVKHSLINFIGPLYLFLVGYFTYKTINFSIEDSILDAFVKEDLSRVFIWRYAWGNILENPFMGFEYNTFRAPLGDVWLVTHNDYLRIMVELGVFGTLLFLVYLIIQFSKISKIKNEKLFFLNSSLFFITLTYSITHNNINNFMFWLALILPSISYLIEQEKRMEENYVYK